MISRYLQLIGILRWAVEIDRIDIFTEVAIMSQYSASPRLGHLEGIYQIFGYLDKHDMSLIVFDPNKTKIDEQYFAPGTTDWRDFYVEVMEELPPRIPVNFQTTYFVDANYAGNVVPRQSHTGLLIYVINTSIIWLSKKETSQMWNFPPYFLSLITKLWTY